ncbi:hypothetical protein CLUG_03576 [Clavispora lusitaniae ATCC 42720]|uniref:Uncharacterized protein n=1 Tax=Clavispora lusitaniae (strain ATCC 42720) TaxID=306902 RepID=C4Y5Z2_CLAL4|nr:uncharacterized protein CLUG_03576 [Clavispora lusitaniae ATCC 42720]EEQ39448.1 hypothetical protein CLUG_03576 [Clavispora lusitaniae ATCC 42720]
MHQSSYASLNSKKSTSCLGMENLGNNTSNSALFLLFDLVDTVTSNTSAEGQQVHGKVVIHSVDSLGNVVNDTRSEANVTVVQQETGHSGVNDTGNSAKHGATYQRQQAKSNNSFGSPVVRTVGLARFRRNVSIVNSAHNETWWLRNGLDATDQSWSEQTLFSREQSNTGERQHGW